MNMDQRRQGISKLFRISILQTALIAILALVSCANTALPPPLPSANTDAAQGSPTAVAGPATKAPTAAAQVPQQRSSPRIGIAAGRTGMIYISSDGATFGSDRFYLGGEPHRIVPAEVPGGALKIEDTEDPLLYEFFRSGTDFSYAMTLGNGPYVVTLGFAEPYPNTREGERVFRVAAGGKILLDDFDVRREARDSHRAITRRFTVDVTGGMLNLQFTASRGEAFVSNIQVSGGAGGEADRAYLVNVLTTIAGPVLEATAAGTLHDRLPVHDWELHRKDFTHYEAFARTLAGIAPWLELGPDETPEGQLRAKFIDLARKALINATNPVSPDFMNFDGEQGDQPLVEAAYLASSLLLAPQQLWEPLSDAQKENVLDALRTARTIPLQHENNWVLFPAMVEAALWDLGADFEIGPVEYAVEWMNRWYEGDGVYGDGWDVAWDYYNSYVIHPMLLQVLRVAEEHNHELAVEWLPLMTDRARRYAEVMEGLISPEATLPMVGRSSNYRFAAFYHPAYMALVDELPDSLNPGALRSGITAVVRRMVEAPGTFDAEGWLQIGVVGHQPGLTELYNATGSLYATLTGLVHLGLPAGHPFWMVPDADWTQKRLWSGQDVQSDQALEYGLHIPNRKE